MKVTEPLTSRLRAGNLRTVPASGDDPMILASDDRRNGTCVKTHRSPDLSAGSHSALAAHYELLRACAATTL